MNLLTMTDNTVDSGGREFPSRTKHIGKRSDTDP